ncbi:dynamin family protein [Shewanella mesophila]|uniref:dynamin family protein n=1 Tax=Shewanella mesophila TaxID=2864208 RepID=UPI001C661F4F|nr:dynamin family protein [Shewanella mesophila]QYJ85857.1 dynamin family protein [Shewanella mesophila]
MTASSANIKKQCHKLTELHHHYQDYQSIINPLLLNEIARLADEFRLDAENAKNENRLLRIGIIGQIKRGKSSFLNSLLFDGQEILPKAATPMTAALTRIRYADLPSADIEFYSLDEWNQVEQTVSRMSRIEQEYQQELQAFRNAKKSGQFSTSIPLAPQFNAEEKACQELVKMVRTSGLNVTDYLGTIQQLDKFKSHTELVNQLNDYVGSSGHFTPIVKSTGLKLNIPALKNIEVVDTPGMNDPIVSRSRRTQEFIGQCDVVFFLSYCGQFLDLPDMQLLAQNIPNKGIEDIVLIGSLFDSALIDEGHNYKDIATALHSLTHKLGDQAKSNVLRLGQSNSKELSNNSRQRGILASLNRALPPIFISSRCLDLAQKERALSEEETHSLAQLNGLFEGFAFTPQILEKLANFGKVEQRLNEVKEKKQQILAGRFNNLLIGSQREVLQKLEQIRGEALSQQKALLEGDVETLSASQKAISQRIEAGKARVNSVFSHCSIQAEKALNRHNTELQQLALETKRIQSHSGSRQESYQVSSSVSASSWYNPFSWGSTRTVYSTHYRTIDFNYANVHEAIDLLEDFVLTANRRLMDACEQAINISKFRNDIKTAIKDMFDFSDTTFDAELILSPLNNAVERLTIPKVSLDLDAHIDTIRQQFTSHQVENDEITTLRNEQARVVSILITEINKEIGILTDSMLSSLAAQEQSFIPTLTKGLESKVAQLKTDLQNKEQALETYSELIQQLNQDIAELS